MESIESLIARLRELKPDELTARLTQLEAEKKAIAVLLRATRAANPSRSHKREAAK